MLVFFTCEYIRWKNVDKSFSTKAVVRHDYHLQSESKQKVQDLYDEMYSNWCKTWRKV